MKRRFIIEANNYKIKGQFLSKEIVCDFYIITYDKNLTKHIKFYELSKDDNTLIEFEKKCIDFPTGDNDYTFEEIINGKSVLIDNADTLKNNYIHRNQYKIYNRFSKNGRIIDAVSFEITKNSANIDENIIFYDIDNSVKDKLFYYETEKGNIFGDCDYKLEIIIDGNAYVLDKYEYDMVNMF